MDAATIRSLREQNSKMRERDFARIHKLSEAELVAAHVGHGATRLTVDVAGLLKGLEAVGEVMALTRNESAVHEKIGVYENVRIGGEAGLVLGHEIDLRVFPPKWVSGFAVEKADDGGAVKRSLQFFDTAGDAVHKVHLRDASNVEAYRALVERFTAPDQVSELPVTATVTELPTGSAGSREDLHSAWRGMTDTHQFHGILRQLNLHRLDALEMADEDLAWALEPDCVMAMFEGAVASALPIMAFVASSGCIQIHSGPVVRVEPMGPWINVMDPTFHLHLRQDQITELWAVRKPTVDGHVTSIEAYAADRSLIIQFFGKRHDGVDERPEWRALVEGLPGLATDVRQMAAV